MPSLQAYLASPKFTDALNAQGEMVRRIAIRVMTESVAECASPGPWRRPAARPRKSIRWDEATKARFRKVLFSSGLRAAAEAVGVSYKAGRVAQGRFAPDYVAPATGYHRQAA